MRIKLSHRLHYRFADPVRTLTHILRLTPRSHEGQRVTKWRIDVDPDCLLKAGEDHFGNLTHTLTVPGLVSELVVSVHGEIASFDVAGVVRGSAERLPEELFLRDTALTVADSAIRAFADEVTAPADDRISRLHRLLDAIHARIAFDPTKAGPSPAAEVFESKSGSGQDQAHVFVACARHLGWPARCVTGYHLSEDGSSQRHAWAEVLVEGLGWVGFDPVNDVCPQDSHVRMAVGLDAVDAAAVRGTRLDGLTEVVDVTRILGRETDRIGQQQAQTNV